MNDANKACIGRVVVSLVNKKKHLLIYFIYLRIFIQDKPSQK